MSAQAAFDFIIVGAGTAGAVIASRLAKSQKAPRVLLLEAGEADVSLINRAAGERLTFWSADDAAKFNYRYKTVPEPHLNNREIIYDRGRGLGGSTAINICVWDYGRREEMDEWARLVGDDAWSWDSTVARMKKIETFHDDTPAELRNYVAIDMANHGSDGPVDVTCPKTWAPGLKLLLDGAKEYGFPMLPDQYSGDLGFGIPAATTFNGLRVTANTAYLATPPSNLTIKTSSIVSQVLFEGKKAIGVKLIDGNEYFASKEVIISAGAIDTPKILLLSGVGPLDELEKHNIPVTVAILGVGRNLRDHPLSRLRASLKPGMIPNVSLEDAGKWKSQWTRDQTGPLALDTSLLAVGYFQVDNLSKFPEFQKLDRSTQEFLTRSQTASIEFGLGMFPVPAAEMSIVQVSVLLMNSQSTGRIFLKSSDPTEPPVLELNYLQHPYDRRVFIEGVRKAMDFLLNTNFPVDKQISGPKSTSDEDILQFLREDLTTSWHALGTVKMGNIGDDTTCVDSDFRAAGLQNLRVADMSVCPVVPSNHVQSTAYLIGEVAAEKLIKQYDLQSLTL